MKRLKMAVVGAGRLGGFHARKLAANRHVELLAVVDPLPHNRNRVAQLCNAEPRADHRELFGRLDAAVLAAPTNLHYKLGCELLEAGIHLLVEKPICSTLSEADRLVELAGKNNLVLQVGHVERFNPAFNAAVPHTAGAKYIETVRCSQFTFRSTDVGVVLDLMIHDIDLVLSLVGSQVQKVEALGLSVLGGHEDVANARLQFECGCVATLSASRVSYQPVRSMHVWSPRRFTAIDFAAGTTTLVCPSETLLRREFDVQRLSPEQVEHYKTHLFDEHLPRQQMQPEAVDALALETEDFVEAIRTPRSPRVTGAAARDALAVAEQILARIHAHTWDAASGGPIGPQAARRSGVIPAPHFATTPAEIPIARKEAG